MLKGNAEYQARADELTEEICGILLSYSALDQNLQYDSCLRNLRKRFDGLREAMERLAAILGILKVLLPKKRRPMNLSNNF